MRAEKSIVSQFSLDEQTIHIWSLPIRPSESAITEYHYLLSPDERTRARRFRFDYLQRSFVFTRGALRVLLGRYLAIPPEEVSFRYSATGKPSVSIGTPLRFNTSHSGDTVLFAFTRECDIGVDVEQIHDLPKMDDIVSRFFCSEEASQFASTPQTERAATFFRCWTRKEAFLKATGNGLSAHLDSFCVTLDSTEPARLVHIGGDSNAARSWTLHDLAVSPQYAAAVAYRDTPRSLRLSSHESIDVVRDLP
jgi:4'-phosphopantetheinyl transferase